MRILILGATGRTGRFLVEEAIKWGYTINVLLRDKSKLNVNSNSITVFEGTPTDINTLLPTMQSNTKRFKHFPYV